MLALCYAAEYPGNAGPIVLVGCGTFDQAARTRMQATIEDRMDDDLRDQLRRTSSELADPADLFIRTFRLTRHLFDFEPINTYPDKEEYEPFDVSGHEETWSDMAKLQADGTYPGAFGVIDSPVLMLHGQYDPHPGNMIRDCLIRHLPQLEYHEWQRCGHSPWIEKFARDEFFTVVCEWLARKTA
jgi:pimeloyl-ACP methyl ester carboxylesterase